MIGLYPAVSLFFVLNTFAGEPSKPYTILGNQTILNFREAKKVATKIHADHPFTIYCNCRYTGKKIDLKSCGYVPLHNRARAERLEWEHVVPAEAFGQSFREWRDGSSACVKSGKSKHQGKSYKGRKCAETNPEFSRMEADLYNLWPEVGELNGLRSNFSMAEITPKRNQFGKCLAQVQDRKFEPMSFSKGIVARTYLYMDSQYKNRGIISDKNRKLFEAWNKMYPVQPWECERASRIEKIQKNENPILKPLCLKH